MTTQDRMDAYRVHLATPDAQQRLARHALDVAARMTRLAINSGHQLPAYQHARALYRAAQPFMTEATR